MLQVVVLIFAVVLILSLCGVVGTILWLVVRRGHRLTAQDLIPPVGFTLSGLVSFLLVVMLRCGFDGGVPESLHIIGQRLGVGRERVRQIEDAALRKLRQPTVLARLGADEAQCVA